MERNARVRLTTAAILVLVFASGALVGMAATRGADQAPVDVAAGGNEGASGEGESDTRQNRRRLIDRIDLNVEQRAAIDVVIAGHRARMDSLNAEFRTRYYPRYYAIVDSTRGLIMDELTPEQATTYKDLLTDWDTTHPRDEREELPFRRRN